MGTRDMNKQGCSLQSKYSGFGCVGVGVVERVGVERVGVEG